MSANNRIYVTDHTNNQVVVVDLNNTGNQNYFKVPESIWRIAVTPDQKTGYASSMDSCSVFELDFFGGKDPIKIPTGSKRGDIVMSSVVDASRNCLYVATDNGLCKIDLTSKVSTVLYDQKYKTTSLRSLELSADKSKLYGQYWFDSISRGIFCYDLNVNSFTSSDPVTPAQLTHAYNASGYGFRLNESKNQIWVCYRGYYAQFDDKRTNQILLFDADTLTYQKSITVGLQPSSIELDATGENLFVLNGDCTISIIDTSTLAVNSSQIKLLECPGLTTNQFYSIKMFSQGNTLFVTDSQCGRVMEVDIQTQKPTKVYQVPDTHSPSGFSNSDLYQGTSGTFPTPEIVSVSPLGTADGNQLTITGMGFCSIADYISVSFTGGVQAKPTKANLNQLVVTIPDGATSGPITVQLGGQTSNPSQAITIVSPDEVPTITSFVPTKLIPDMWLEITGSNFKAGGKVKFKGNTEATFDPRSTSTNAYVKIPKGANTGTISVECNNVYSNSSSDILTIATPPLINQENITIQPSLLTLEAEPIELESTSSIANSVSESASNTLNVHEVTSANSKDGTTYEGFVGITEQKKTLKFTLNGSGTPPVVTSGGGTWNQESNIPGTPSSSAIEGICNAPSLSTDGNGVIRVVAVGTPPSPVPFSRPASEGANINPIFYSTNAGDSWTAVSNISLQIPAQSYTIGNIESYLGVFNSGSSTSDHIIAVGVGFTILAPTKKVYFIARGSNGGMNWGIGMKIANYSGLTSVASSSGKIFFILQDSDTTSIFDITDGGTATPTTISTPTLDGHNIQSKTSRIPELSSSACSKTKLVAAFNWYDHAKKLNYYRFAVSTINTNGTLGTTVVSPSSTTDPLYNGISGQPAFLSLAYSSDADKFLAVSIDGAIYSSTDGLSWTLEKASNNSPVFHKSTTERLININVSGRTFFISGVWTGSSAYSTVTVTF